jgi:hypothetical protein
MPEDGVMLATAVEQIIRHHQPYPNDAPHWSNEAFCKGCTKIGDDGLAEHPSASYRVFPSDEFPSHQAQVVSDYVRSRLGCR